MAGRSRLFDSPAGTGASGESDLIVSVLDETMGSAVEAALFLVVLLKGVMLRLTSR